MVVNCRKDNQLKWRMPIVITLKPCNDVTLQVVQGRTMEEWLRFSVVYWHTFRGTGLDPFGGQTLYRHWEDGTDSVDNAKRRLRAAFEFMSKLGVKYWTYHDRYRMHHQFHGRYSIIILFQGYCTGRRYTCRIECQLGWSKQPCAGVDAKDGN